MTDSGRPPSWFVWGTFGPLTVSTWGLYHCAKFGYDRCSSFYNMNISIFGTFRWKMPIYAQKIVFFWQFNPINGLQYQPKPKRHTLRESASFEPLSVKMW